MKKYAFILIIIMLGVVVAIFAYVTGLWKTMSHEDLEGAFEIVDMETKWVKKAYQPWPPVLKIVPALSFRVKNISEKPLKYVYFNANFRFQDDFQNLGDAFLEAIRGKPLMPGETSDPILLKSNYGYEGKNLEHIKTNPVFLTKVVKAKLFAKSQGSQYIPLGEWEISKKIDFKEPEPYGMEEQQKKKKEEKKEIHQ